MTLASTLERRYPRMQQAHRAKIIEICEKYISDGLGDNNAEQNLCSEDNARYWQQLSEVLLADHLTKAGFLLTHQAEGPDFLIERDGKKIWIEVITPEPNGIPDEWVNHTSGVSTFPHEAMLLRWTAAIKEKAEKLLGNPEKRIRGYIEKGIVANEDVYVIAVNSRLLRCGGNGQCFPYLNGISQFPFAVEATFCVGPLQININRTTLKATGSEHQHRPLIPKPRGNAVPADTFLDPKFAGISAIWATDVDESLFIGKSQPMVIVHNPNATNVLPRNLLPAEAEYVATDMDDHYQLDRFESTNTSG